MNDFERKLQRQPFRQIPTSWRREILAAVEAAPASSATKWREWFWPAPEAWAGLAALWLLMAVLTAVLPEQPGLTAQWTGSVPLTSLAQHHVRVDGEVSN